MTFAVRWPDGSDSVCYSPSLVIRDHFSPGDSYALDDFLRRCRTALTIASDRVRQKYGFPCSRALGQLAEIERRAATYATVEHAAVQLLAFGDA
jgi:uncharacterized repeat protein (TIGR04042 family)